MQLLPESWESNSEATQSVGDEWIESSRSAILFVPCVVVPKTFNILINPIHPDSAKIAVAGVHWHSIDRRLIA